MAALQVQIEANQKMLGRSVAFGVKSAEKHLIRQNFFELTTPISQASLGEEDITPFQVGIKICEDFLI